jgi:Ca-activated chloride channel homolog
MYRAILTVMFIATGQLLFSQSERKHLREGNRDYKGGNFSESELSYRRAAEQPKSAPDSWFSLGNSIYKQEKFEDAISTFEKNSSMYDDNLKKANSYYNLGNAFLGAGKPEESISAYKNSLKLNPSNMQAKYNLAYAQDLLQQQQDQQDQQDKNDDKNKDDQQKENKDNQDQNKNNDQENKDKQDSEQDKDNNQQDQNSREQQQEGNEQKISLEDARRLLEALASDEKKVQDKVLRDKAAAAMVKTLKNW